MKDRNFPHITYRRGASGFLYPVLHGTGIRVQTIVLASQDQAPEKIAEDYDLSPKQVWEALSFYEAHQAEIDADIQAEAMLEPKDE